MWSRTTRIVVLVLIALSAGGLCLILWISRSRSLLRQVRIEEGGAAVVHGATQSASEGSSTNQTSDRIPSTAAQQRTKGNNDIAPHPIAKTTTSAVLVVRVDARAVDARACEFDIAPIIRESPDRESVSAVQLEVRFPDWEEIATLRSGVSYLLSCRTPEITLNSRGGAILVNSLTPGEQRRLDVQLIPIVTACGRMIDGDTQDPIVAATLSDLDGIRRTDAEGLFALRMATDAVTALMFSARGYPDSFVVLRGNTCDEANPPEYCVFKSAEIRANMMDSSGQLSVGIQVIVSTPVDGIISYAQDIRHEEAREAYFRDYGSDDSYKWEARPTNDGTFVVSGLPAHEPLELAVLSSGQMLHRENIEPFLYPSESRQIAVAIDRGGDVCGTVLAPDNMPVPGAMVVFIAEDTWFKVADLTESSASHKSAMDASVTDSDGRFCTSLLAKGSYVIVVHPADIKEGTWLFPNASVFGPVDISSNSSVQLGLQQSVGLKVRVIDEQREPRGGALVVLRRCDTGASMARWANGSGMTRIPRLQTGDWVVYAVDPLTRHAGYTVVGLDSTETGVVHTTVQIASSYSLTGTVMNTQNRPATKTPIELWTELEEGPACIMATVSTSDGTFKLDGVPCSRGWVVAKEGSWGIAVEEFALAGNSGAAIDLQCGIGSLISVSADSRSPIASEVLLVFDEKGRGVYRSSWPQALRRNVRVPPGSASIVVGSGKSERVRKELSCPSGKSTIVDV